MPGDEGQREYEEIRYRLLSFYFVRLIVNADLLFICTHILLKEVEVQLLTSFLIWSILQRRRRQRRQFYRG